MDSDNYISDENEGDGSFPNEKGLDPSKIADSLGASPDRDRENNETLLSPNKKIRNRANDMD